jgi:protein-tyrosine phosphatase
VSLSLPRLAVADADFVTERLAVGGDLPFETRHAREHAEDLLAAGVTHVLDCRLEWDDAEFWSHVPEVSYRHAGIDDAGQRVPAQWFEDVVGWALAALERPEAKVLTHCHMGINRGPSAGYAVLLAQGWDPLDAIAAIRRVRPIANVWYAADALAWHHGRTGADADTRRRDQLRLAGWRRDHPLDLVRIIAEQREDGR